MNNRVKYYSKNDMCYGLFLEKIETIETSKIDNITINDAIEFYVINHYFNDGARHKNWSEEEYNEYLKKV